MASRKRETDRQTEMVRDRKRKEKWKGNKL